MTRLFPLSWLRYGALWLLLSGWAVGARARPQPEVNLLLEFRSNWAKTKELSFHSFAPLHNQVMGYREDGTPVPLDTTSRLSLSHVAVGHRGNYSGDWLVCTFWQSNDTRAVYVPLRDVRDVTTQVRARLLAERDARTQARLWVLLWCGLPIALLGAYTWIARPARVGLHGLWQ